MQRLILHHLSSPNFLQNFLSSEKDGAREMMQTFLMRAEESLQTVFMQSILTKREVPFFSS